MTYGGIHFSGNLPFWGPVDTGFRIPLPELLLGGGVVIVCVGLMALSIVFLDEPLIGVAVQLIKYYIPFGTRAGRVCSSFN